MFDKVDSNLNLPQLDKEVLDLWDKQNIFDKSIKSRENAKPFVFYEGPPGMNGLPHIGHGSTRIFKDTILRYFAMSGRKILRKAGWDCHGLPVELKAEKDLGIKNKFEIESFGVQKFVDECKKIITLYEKEWRVATRKIGFWVDFDNAYNTSDDNYIESVWWSLKKLFDKGEIYEGYRVAPYCPRCGTSLASHEVAQGYETVKDKTLFVRFKVKSKDDTYFIAWTTTPWTLPSNVALCVNKEYEYSEIEVETGERYIMATALIGRLFEEYKTIRTYTGAELENMEYEPLFSLPSELLENKKAYYVTCADYVTLSDGSGIVHIAPAFGEDDSKVGNEYGLPFLKLIDEKGCFTDDLPKYAGKRNIVANQEIITDLKTQGVVVKEQTIEHEYPHCWRCHTPLIYYAREGWFVRMSKYRDAMVKNNSEVAWHPESVRDGRMGNFLSNAIDWNLSRDRYWGTPLNIWKCNKCGKLHSVGSKQELMDLTGATEIKDLHKPYIDQFTFDCECGGKYERVPQLIDCWYDSGAMPFAQWHYPFENKEKFEEQFPADFICEAQDQTRGWFYSLQAIGSTVFERTPYKSVVMCSHVTDKNGKKMSKSLGNVVDVNELIDKYGADAVRLYFCSNSAPWLSQRLDEDGIMEVQRKAISTFWNAYSFFVLYANIDDFKPVSIESCELSLMDKWLLSQLNALINNVNELMQDLNFTDSSRKISDFIEALSNWYIRRCRERYWVNGESADKTAAFATLYHTLVTLSKLSAPFIPFMSEKIYQNLTKDLAGAKESVHLEDYPV
ncbi:MAG: isoleucine--tRNA ligase, partial [Clostridia bacterium]|nr:isoleucine--tRNA ligase [Clostridia bacterium]